MPPRGLCCRRRRLFFVFFRRDSCVWLSSNKLIDVWLSKMSPRGLCCRRRRFFFFFFRRDGCSLFITRFLGRTNTLPGFITLRSWICLFKFVNRLSKFPLHTMHTQSRLVSNKISMHLPLKNTIYLRYFIGSKSIALHIMLWIESSCSNFKLVQVTIMRMMSTIFTSRFGHTPVHVNICSYKYKPHVKQTHVAIYLFQLRLQL